MQTLALAFSTTMISTRLRTIKSVFATSTFSSRSIKALTTMAGKDPHSLSEGDDVSWKWGSQRPKGTVKEVRDEDTEVQTKKGSTISKSGSKEDPVIVAETQNGNVAAKNVSLLEARCVATNFDTDRLTLFLKSLWSHSSQASEVVGVKP